MSKRELRSIYKSKRRSLHPEQIEVGSLAITNRLLELPVWGHTYYHIFLSIVEHREVNTEFILNVLAGKDKHAVISKSNFDTREMSHYLLTDNTRIKKNNWNIPEPVDGIEISSEKLDVVFVPLLAYDMQGNRVGYGKGFYDKFLNTCRPETLKIGLSFFEPEPFIKDVSMEDVKLDYCVTPIESYRF
jgi:5-formyltetrahydrofolate cyclo-ligase